jgi:hypothetical protein
MSSVMMSSVPAEIRAEHLRSTSLERFQYTSLIGLRLFGEGKFVPVFN